MKILGLKLQTYLLPLRCITIADIDGLKLTSQGSGKFDLTTRVQFLPHGTSWTPNKALFDPVYAYIEIPSSGYLRLRAGKGAGE